MKNRCISSLTGRLPRWSRVITFRVIVWLTAIKINLFKRIHNERGSYGINQSRHNTTVPGTLGQIIKYTYNTLKYVVCNFWLTRQRCGCAILLLQPYFYSPRLALPYTWNTQQLTNLRYLFVKLCLQMINWVKRILTYFWAIFRTRILRILPSEIIYVGLLYVRSHDG